MLEVLIGAVRLYLIESARARVFNLHSRHLHPRLLNVDELDWLEKLMLLDLVDA